MGAAVAATVGMAMTVGADKQRKNLNNRRVTLTTPRRLAISLQAWRTVRLGTRLTLRHSGADPTAILLILQITLQATPRATP